MTTNLISIENEKEIEKIKEEIEFGFKNLQIFRSEFLMRNSVLAMNATIDGKYWQSILERNVHFWELMRLKYDFQEKIADIDIKKAQFEQKEYFIKIETNNIYSSNILKAEKNKLKVQIERDETFLIHMKKEAEQRIREIKTWTRIINELKPNLKYSPTNPEEYQADEWSHIYAKKIEMMKMLGSECNDIAGSMNNLIVANQIFKDPQVQKIAEEENKKLY